MKWSKLRLLAAEDEPTERKRANAERRKTGRGEERQSSALHLLCHLLRLLHLHLLHHLHHHHSSVSPSERSGITKGDSHWKSTPKT
ncbi:unnamed protein product, partial [Gadus morhua 'NCC']